MKKRSAGTSALEVLVVIGLIAALVKLSIPNIKEFQLRSANRTAEILYGQLRNEFGNKSQLFNKNSAAKNTSVFFNFSNVTLPEPLRSIRLTENVRLNYLINLPNGKETIIAFEVDALKGDRLFRYTNLNGQVLEHVVKKHHE